MENRRFFRLMQLLLSNGVPLIEAMDLAADQELGPEVRRAVAIARRNVLRGWDLARALEAHPEHFDARVVEAVRIGERTGGLEATFMVLGDPTPRDEPAIRRFARHLGTLLEFHLPIESALRTLILTSEPSLAGTLECVLADLTSDEGYAPLYVALEKHPAHFSAPFVAMMQTAEMCGSLTRTLRTVQENADLF